MSFWPTLNWSITDRWKQRTSTFNPKKGKRERQNCGNTQELSRQSNISCFIEIMSPKQSFKADNQVDRDVWSSYLSLPKIWQPYMIENHLSKWVRIRLSAPKICHLVIRKFHLTGAWMLAKFQLIFDNHSHFLLQMSRSLWKPCKTLINYLCICSGHQKQRH